MTYPTEQSQTSIATQRTILPFRTTNPLLTSLKAPYRIANQPGSAIVYHHTRPYQLPTIYVYASNLTSFQLNNGSKRQFAQCFYPASVRRRERAILRQEHTHSHIVRKAEDMGFPFVSMRV